MNGRFCAESIKEHLPRDFAPERLIFLDKTDSTNEYCKRESLKSGTYVIAASQSGGKGRIGRRFESAEGGLFLSLSLRPKIPSDRLLCITGMAAVAAVCALEDAAGIKCGIKWTNDIILGDKKLGGILTELSFDGAEVFVVVGIGINVNNPLSDFAWDKENKATSVLAEQGRELDISELAAALIERLDKLTCDLDAGDIPPYVGLYRERCVTLGRQVTLLWRGSSAEFSQSGERSSGIAADIDESFGLIVSYPDGTEETVRSGEVSVRGGDGQYFNTAIV